MRRKTTQQLLKFGAKLLERYGIENPHLDAEILMLTALGCTKIAIITNPARIASPEEESVFHSLLNKRINRIPISQIIGAREFWELDFTVNCNVLDPRPDSETLISAILGIYKNKKQHLAIADYGTGSGCLIITLLNHYKHSCGQAFEKSLKAYRVARQNIKKHYLNNRIKIYPSSWIFGTEKFDIIVSNPPYIKRSTIKYLQPEVKFHEPMMALDGGVSGMDCYLEIFKMIRKCLKSNGLAFLEIGQEQHNIHAALPKFGLKKISYEKDLSGQKRCIIIKKL